MGNGFLNPKGLAQGVKALVLRFPTFKVQGSTSHECKQSLGATTSMKSQRFNQFCIVKLSRVWCMELRFTLQRWVRRALPLRCSLTFFLKKKGNGLQRLNNNKRMSRDDNVIVVSG
jgi:hypothetical protein